MQAVGQICSTSSMSQNLAQCQILVKKAAEAGAKVSDFAFDNEPLVICATQALTTMLIIGVNVEVFRLLQLAVGYSAH